MFVCSRDLILSIFPFTLSFRNILLPSKCEFDQKVSVAIDKNWIAKQRVLPCFLSLPYQNEIFIQYLATAVHNGMRGLFNHFNVNFRAYVRLHVKQNERKFEKREKEKKTRKARTGIEMQQLYGPNIFR